MTKEKGRWVSPNEIFEAGKQMMLEGKEPVTHKDWQLLANFFAANIDYRIGSAAVKLVCKLFESPLQDEEIEQIFLFQRYHTMARRDENEDDRTLIRSAE